MHPASWPLAGKPATNVIIQVALACVAVEAFALFPLVVTGIIMLWIAIAGGRGLIRELRKEWRKP